MIFFLPSSKEPCTLLHDKMDKNNLILRWSFDNRLYYIHGEYVEFHCKQNHLQAPSTSMSDFRVQCNRGQLAYPKCIEIERQGNISFEIYVHALCIYFNNLTFLTLFSGLLT